MQTTRRVGSLARTAKLDEFERLLERAEKLQKLHGPALLAKARPPRKRTASAA